MARSISIAVLVLDGDVWDLKINPNSTKEDLLKDLIEVAGLDPNQEYVIRGDPRFPLSDGDTIGIDIAPPKHILSASRRKR